MSGGDDWEPPTDPAPSRPWGVREESISKSELVQIIAANTGKSSMAVDQIIDAFFTTMAEAISAGRNVSIPGWLAIERAYRPARTGRHPQTGAPIHIAAGYSVKVNAGSKLKAAPK